MNRKRTRANGEGSLIKRGNVFFAKWWYDGKVYVKTTKCTNRRDAEKRLAELVAPFRSGEKAKVFEELAEKAKQADAADLAGIKPVTFVNAMEHYIKAAPSTLEERTLYNYETTLNILENFVKPKNLSELTVKDAEAFMEKRRSEVGAMSYNYALVFFNRLFEVAMKDDPRVRVNPFAGMTKLKVPRDVKRRELTPEEIEKLISAAYEKSEEFGRLFELGAFTGMRLSDCCTLRTSDVDADSMMIRRLPKKTRKNGLVARIPICGRIKWLLECEGEYVLPKLREYYMKNSMRKLVKEVFEDAGLETAVKDERGRTRVVTGFHSLRVSFASARLRDGASVPELQAMLGHAKADMSLHYCRVTDEDVKSSFAKDVVKLAVSREAYDALMKLKGGMTVDEFIKSLAAEPVGNLLASS